MSSQILTNSNLATAALVVRPQVYPRVRVSVLAVLAIFVTFFLYRLSAEPLANVVGAIAISVMALIPAFIWASGYVGGLPILPAHCATLVLTFALPLVTGQPEIAQIDAGPISFASFCIVLYAAVATVCWYATLRGRISGRATYRILPMVRGYHILLAAVLAGSIYNMLVIDGMLILEAGLFSIVRAAAISITSIALFVVAVRLGGRGLTPGQKVFAYSVILFFIVTQVASLYLGGAIISVVSLIVGYSIGSQRIPWPSIVVTALILGVLHAGKGEMRERYWGGYESQSLSVGALPGFVVSWIGAGAQQIANPSGEESQPIYERLSLMHLLLLAQDASEGRAGFLDGQTYAMIPRTLLPRFLDPDKPSAHDATNLLNLHYGLQTVQEQEGTQIGWGMITEGYANYGVIGIVGVGVVMGLFLGWVTRATVMAPFMSLQNFLGILVMVMSVQTEFTMVVTVTATLQSAISMLLLWPFCDIQRNPRRG